MTNEQLKELEVRLWGSANANQGIIASGEQLVEHYDSDIEKIIVEHYNRASEVEITKEMAR